MRGAREGLALYGLGIAAGTAIECPGNPADGSDPDPRALVDVAVRHALEQQRHHPPAIGHGLEFGRRAQVLEERSHVLCPVERSQRLRQGLHGGLDIAFRQGFWALFHRSEEHTSELQSLMRISYAVFCLKKKNTQT